MLNGMSADWNVEEPNNYDHLANSVEKVPQNVVAGILWVGMFVYLTWLVNIGPFAALLGATFGTMFFVWFENKEEERVERLQVRESELNEHDCSHDDYDEMYEQDEEFAYLAETGWDEQAEVELRNLLENGN